MIERYSKKVPSQQVFLYISMSNPSCRFSLNLTLGILSPNQIFWGLPSLKRTFSHLKMDGWKRIVSFWDGLSSGAFAVSFREGKSATKIKPSDTVDGSEILHHLGCKKKHRKLWDIHYQPQLVQAGLSESSTDCMSFNDFHSPS